MSRPCVSSLRGVETHQKRQGYVERIAVKTRPMLEGVGGRPVLADGVTFR